jgi:hypothetical protein
MPGIAAKAKKKNTGTLVHPDFDGLWEYSRLGGPTEERTDSGKGASRWRRARGGAVLVCFVSLWVCGLGIGISAAITLAFVCCILGRAVLTAVVGREWALVELILQNLGAGSVAGVSKSFQFSAFSFVLERSAFLKWCFDIAGRYDAALQSDVESLLFASGSWGKLKLPVLLVSSLTSAMLNAEAAVSAALGVRTQLQEIAQPLVVRESMRATRAPSSPCFFVV